MGSGSRRWEMGLSESREREADAGDGGHVRCSCRAGKQNRRGAGLDQRIEMVEETRGDKETKRQDARGQREMPDLAGKRADGTRAVRAAASRAGMDG